MQKDLKETVAANVWALLGLEPGARGATAALIGRGISNGDATRALKGETSIGLDKLAELAKALNVQPWQLCVPGLDPSRLPTVEPSTFRWPFRRIEPEVVTGLSGLAAAQVENGLLAALATIGIAPRKLPVAPKPGRQVVQPVSPASPGVAALVRSGEDFLGSAKPGPTKEKTADKGLAAPSKAGAHRQ